MILAALNSNNKGLNRDSAPDLCYADAGFCKLSYHFNWKLVVKWVKDKS